MKLSQIDADNLIRMEKVYSRNESYNFPDTGEQLMVELNSVDLRNTFVLDINRSGRVALKCTYQNRVMSDIILLRLDINSTIHTNPNGESIGRSHIHIYKEGYMDKWAYELPSCFSDITKLDITLNEFMDYCNITKRPLIKSIWNI